MAEESLPKDAATEPENTETEDSPLPKDAVNEGEELERVVAERDEYLDLLKRTQAEFQNFQKRTQRDREQERIYYAAAIVADFLPVLDNLERALAAANSAGEESTLAQGVRMVQAQFLDILNKQNVTVVGSPGDEFDPNLHEALTQQPSSDHPANTIVQVVATGYKIHERVLRHAQVVVSSGPPPENEPHADV